MQKVKHLLSIPNLSAKEIWQVLKLAKKLKDNKNRFPIGVGSDRDSLKDKNLVLIFEKPSLRTRLSLEISINQLGGKAVFFGPSDIGSGIDTREPIMDVAKVTSSMADFISARVFDHQTIISLASNSTVPVINALSDLEHPCQALADFLTIWEVKGKLEGLNIAYIGDGENNVAHSLALGCALLRINFKCASPEGYSMKAEILKQAQTTAKNCQISQIIDPKQAVKDADVVITDTWVSMGDENQKQERIKILKPYQVNESLMELAKKDSIFMHCMPVNRGYEVTSEVVDEPNSAIYQEAENRLHVQKALLVFLSPGSKNPIMLN